MLPSPSTFLDPLWFLPLFVGMWCGVTGLLSHLSGWSGLAVRFRATRPADGERFRFASGSLGTSTRLPVSYRNCLCFAIKETGLHVSLFFPFRFLAPPLFIPWAQVDSVAWQSSWLAQRLVIGIRGCSTRILVPGRPGEAIARAYANFSPRHAR